MPSPNEALTDPLIAHIRSKSEKMTTEQHQWPQVALIAGPAHVVEIILREAATKCGSPIVSRYEGGNFAIHSLCDRKKVRAALAQAIPVTDIRPEESV